MLPNERFGPLGGIGACLIKQDGWVCMDEPGGLSGPVLSPVTRSAPQPVLAGAINVWMEEPG